MFHNIDPHVFDNSYKAVTQITENDYLFYFRDNKLLFLKQIDSLEIPKKKDLNDGFDEKSAVYLFSINTHNCFLIDEVSVDHPLFVFEEVMSLRNLPQKELAWIGSVGYHLMNWYSTNRYCQTSFNRFNPAWEKIRYRIYD